MRQTVNVCERHISGNLTVLATVVLAMKLDATTMELTACYKGKRYVVHGNCNNAFIVID